MHAVRLNTLWATLLDGLRRRMCPTFPSGTDLHDDQDDRMPDASHANSAADDLDGFDPNAIVTDVRSDGDALIAKVHGEIDLNRSPDLRGRLLRILKEASPAPKRLVLNLAGVPYMDSSAVAVLVQTLQVMREKKGVVCLTDVQPRVKGILEIARLDGIFKVCADEAAALKA